MGCDAWEADLQRLDVVAVLELAAIDDRVIRQRAALIYEAGLVLCLILLRVLVPLQWRLAFSLRAL